MNDDRQQTQNLWDERYKNSEYIFGTAPNDFLVDCTKYLQPDSNILCIGEGEGRNGVFLAKRGHRVTAFDLSPVAMDKALKLAAKEEVTLDYSISDYNGYDFGEEKWDAVVSIFAHSDPATRTKAWTKIAASIKAGGLLIFEAYHPNQIKDNYQSGGPKDIDMLVTLNDLRTVFGQFEILHEAEKEREVIEGPYHTGKAYVTQWASRK